LASSFWDNFFKFRHRDIRDIHHSFFPYKKNSVEKCASAEDFDKYTAIRAGRDNIHHFFKKLLF
jgi:hypothetical protein